MAIYLTDPSNYKRKERFCRWFLRNLSIFVLIFKLNHKHDLIFEIHLPYFTWEDNLQCWFEKGIGSTFLKCAAIDYKKPKES